MVKQLTILILFLCSFSSAFGNEKIALPDHLDPVIDMTGTLSKISQEHINQMIRSFSDSTGSQVAVFILPTTEGRPIESVSLELAEAWELGRKGVDDGVLILIAKNDRKIRIEVGYGLEGAIPDVYAKRLIDNVITPKFKSGDFEGGIIDGVSGIIQLINKEELNGVSAIDKPIGGVIVTWLVLIGFFVGIFFFLRGWWKRITYYCFEEKFTLKVKYIFTQFKWDWMAFIVQSIILIIVFSISEGDFGKGLEGGLIVSSLAFGFYFIVRGYLAGPNTGGSSYSGSSSSYSSGSSSYSSSSSSYSGGGGSFGGGGASGGW